MGRDLAKQFFEHLYVRAPSLDKHGIHALLTQDDRSAARGEMTTRGLYVFKHDSELGNAPAHKLFELIQAQKNTEEPARDFADYTVTVNDASLPAGVSLQRIVG